MKMTAIRTALVFALLATFCAEPILAQTGASDARLAQARAKIEELEKKEAEFRRAGRHRHADLVRARIDQIKAKLAEAGAETAPAAETSAEDVQDMIKAVKEALRKNERDAVLEGIRRLAATKDRKAAEFVASLLYQKSEGIRTEAARALGQMGVKESVPVLLRAMNTYRNQQATLLAIVDALGDLKDKRATQAICYRMKYNNQYDFIDRGCRALEKIRDRKSVKPLIDIIEKNRRVKQWPAGGRVIRCLQNLTGQTVGATAEDWHHWYQKNKNTFEIVPASQVTDRPLPPGQGTGRRPVGPRRFRR
jgi:HEAT repeat protein